MTRMKYLLAALLSAAMLNFAPPVHAQTVKVVLAGSSAMWQSMALAAYKSGSCVSGGVAPCFHYTGSASFNLNDTRPTLKGGNALNDPNSIWIVWDSAANTNVWAYIK